MRSLPNPRAALAASLILAAALGPSPLRAQTVVLLPIPKIQFFDSNGKPLAGGLVFTFAAGTSTPLATFTDSTGGTSNPNPVVLDSAGRAAIWLTNATSYKFVVQNSLGVQQWTADNVLLQPITGPGGLNTQVQFNCAGAFCGNSGFTFTSGTQTLAVTALTVSSGGSLAGSFSGSPTLTGTWTFTVPPVFSGGLTTITSACANAAATGTIRFCKTDTLSWRNNASSADLALSLSGADNLAFPNGLSLGGGTALATTNQSGTGSLCLTTSCQLVNPALNGTVVSGGASGAGQTIVSSSPTASSWQPASQLPGLIQQSSTTLLGGNVTVSQNTVTAVQSKAVTMPTSGCPCRVFVSYSNYLTTANSGIANSWIDDGTAAGTFKFGESQVLVTGAASAYGTSASAFSVNTYVNNAVITFTNNIWCTNVGGCTVNQTAGGNGAINGWLNVAVFTSN